MEPSWEANVDTLDALRTVAIALLELNKLYINIEVVLTSRLPPDKSIRNWWYCKEELHSSLYCHTEGRGKNVRSLRSSSKAELVQGQPVQCESLSQNKKQNPSPYCPSALSPAFHPKTHVLCLTTCVTLYKLNAESPWLSATMDVNYVPIIRLFRLSRVLGMASLQGPWSQVQCTSWAAWAAP